jgi:hypothetical protein
VETTGALTDLPPEVAADRLLGSADAEWARRFAAEVDRRQAVGRLPALLARWRLSNAEAARLFGVSRQAFSKWLALGPPADREPAVADLDAAADLLERYLRPDRIPAVVRRPSAALGGRSLLAVAEDDGTHALLGAARAMFDLRRVQP